VQQPTKIDMQMGRPEGTTEVDKTKNNKQKQHALNYIAVQFKRMKDEAAAVGHRVRKGAYDETIKMARGMWPAKELT